MNLTMTFLSEDKAMLSLSNSTCSTAGTRLSPRRMSNGSRRGSANTSLRMLALQVPKRLRRMPGK